MTAREIVVAALKEIVGDHYVDGLYEAYADQIISNLNLASDIRLETKEA